MSQHTHRDGTTHDSTDPSHAETMYGRGLPPGWADSAEHFHINSVPRSDGAVTTSGSGTVVRTEPAPADPLADLITAATEAAEALDRAANRMLEASDRQTVAGLWRGIKPAHDHAAQLRAALRPYSLAVIDMDDDRRARDTDPARNRFRDL